MHEGTLRVLHLSTFDRQGGASRGAYRLHRGLIDLGFRSQMAVQGKLSDDPTVLGPASRFSKLRHELLALADRAPLALYRNRAAGSFDVQWIGGLPASLVSRMTPDLLHLHWVTGGFLRIETLRKLGRPIVWTLRDMWPFTGGCHVSGDCDRYRTACGACWQLGSDAGRDLTRWVWRRKHRAWRAIDLNLVAPSRWMADCARASSLFRDRPITVIPNGLDTSVFKPLDRGFARLALGIEPNRPVILFGAVNLLKDANKGSAILREALPVVGEKLDSSNPQLLIFGSSAPEDAIDFGLETSYLGHLGDETSMALAYNAADLLVVPSRQESFCHTAAEALACGTPVVAFNATGLRDVVDHRINGYLARPYDPEDLAHGVVSVLASERREEMATRARRKAEESFDIRIVARRYAELYREIVRSDGRSSAVADAGSKLPSANRARATSSAL
jgi:glycosyltransferase involved in cell wall biosynthesis